ncbi:PDF receptor [Sarcoptes scabiei]|uniref:PDF receptor n=1 Tax=Sarcoptes scabiei TaxID=52283 RepID=A0A834R2I5_SARSC|nr:PDF receptor [Sarcoptes scabiei]
MFTCSIVSLVLLSITFIIFTYFRALRSCRLRIHRNLSFALIIHSLILLLLSSPHLFNPDESLSSYWEIEWLCKSILTIKLYSTMASINWMFIEGFQLHSRVTVSILRKDAPFKLYHFLDGLGRFKCLSQWRQSVGMVMHIQSLLDRCWTNDFSFTRQNFSSIVCINPDDDGRLEDAYLIFNTFLQSSQDNISTYETFQSFTSSQSSLKRTKSGSSMPPIDRLSLKIPIIQNARVLINDCSNHKQNCDDNFNDNGGKKASAKRSIKNKICLQRSISNLVLNVNNSILSPPLSSLSSSSSSFRQSKRKLNQYDSSVRSNEKIP